MIVHRCILLTVLLVGTAAAPAQAQWVATAYLAGNVAGDVEFRRGGPGASVGYIGSRLGFELEVTRYHHFFKDSEVFPLDPAAPPNCTGGGVTPGTPCTDIDTDAMGFMGNLVVPIGFQGARRWRPHGTVGLGVIRAWTNESQFDRHQNNLGVNVGGGVTYSLSRGVGLRGDVRYLRTFVDENKPDLIHLEDYGFWRATLAFTLRFAR
jgi:hypothetical protein